MVGSSGLFVWTSLGRDKGERWEEWTFCWERERERWFLGMI